jgi:hypothetical protein
VVDAASLNTYFVIADAWGRSPLNTDFVMDAGRRSLGTRNANSVEYHLKDGRRFGLGGRVFGCLCGAPSHSIPTFVMGAWGAHQRRLGVG